MCQSDVATEAKLDYKNMVEELYETALEELLKVNEIFTFAIFISVSFGNSKLKNLLTDGHCAMDTKRESKRLFMNEVISFACYLLSSLVATSLKMHLATAQHEPPKILLALGHGTIRTIRTILLLLSTFASVGGCIFLIQSMVNLTMILLGRMFCGCSDTLVAAGALIALSSFALVIYVPFMMNAIRLSIHPLDGGAGDSG